MPQAMEEVYIGMLGLTDSIPVYDANQNRIKKDIVKVLNAQGNNLGPCLREFGLFTSLVDLDLMSNRLVDADVEALCVSSTLRSLNLSNNDLKEVPLMVENGLKNLTKVILQGNPNLHITKCIQNLCGFKKLKHLDLSHTKISTIPEDIRKIQTLEELNISDTKILECEIPIGVFSLKNLKVLITDEAWGRYEGSQLEELFEDQILENMDVHPTGKGEIFWKYSRGHALKLMKKVKKMELKKEWPREGSTVLELWLNSSMIGSLGDTGVNDLFKNMRNIQSFKQITLLSLCTNDLHQIPNLRHFDNIRQLGLCRNNLKSIPADVLSLPNLTHLYITDNLIQTLVFNAYDFPELIELHLQGNPICRNYDAAEACWDSRKHLKHPQCAIQGLKEVMYAGSSLPRAEPEDEELPEGNSMQNQRPMYPEGQPYYHPQHVKAPTTLQQWPQPHLFSPHGASYGHSQAGTPPMQRHAVPQTIAMPKGPSEEGIFKALDASYVEDIDGATEKNLRPKIETSDAWQDIADDLDMSRDDKDLIIMDSKKEQHKTLTRLMLKKWEDADRSLGSLYRLLIVKGYKQAARILKDGVLDSLQAKGELKKRVGDKEPLPQQGVTPQHGTLHGYRPPFPGQYGHPLGQQVASPYEAAGYPSNYHMIPPSLESQQMMYGPTVVPQRKMTPPPSYASIEDTRTRRTSQPETSLGLTPSDCKLPDVPDISGLAISNQALYQSQGHSVQMPQSMNYPGNTLLQSRESIADYFGKRPTCGMPTAGSPQLGQRVGGPYTSATEVKQPVYQDQGSLQHGHGTLGIQPRVQTGAGPTSGSHVPASMGYADQQSGILYSDASLLNQRRGSEESDRMPCQSDDPSMITPVLFAYRGAQQQRSMQSSAANYPTMSDTLRPAEMTDEVMYRKVLVGANSTETEPAGFSDEAVLRKELALHSNS